VVQVGEVIQVTLLFPESVVLSVGQPPTFDNCPQLLGKATLKSEASVSRVGVGILRDDPAPKQQSLVASGCEQSNNDNGIASLFDSVYLR